MEDGNEAALRFVREHLTDPDRIASLDELARVLADCIKYSTNTRASAGALAEIILNGIDGPASLAMAAHNTTENVAADLLKAAELNDGIARNFRKAAIRLQSIQEQALAELTEELGK